MLLLDSPATARTPPRPGDDHDSGLPEVVARLQRSGLFHDFRRSFELCTGLPLTFLRADERALAHHGSKNENAFCALMASRGSSAALCHACQAKTRKLATDRPNTRLCFAGLCESSVPIKLGDKVVAQLQVGQVLLQPASDARFSRMARRLRREEAHFDLKRVRQAYFQTQVMEPKRYRALLRLLTSFAAQLSAASNQLMVTAERPDSPVVGKAKYFIRQHFGGPIALGAVAQAVNISSCYFCKLFRRETGLRFIDYVARLRIEKVKRLLHDPNVRIGEAAYAAGFQSLSQFNRSFKRVLGEEPTAWREKTALH